MDDSNLREKQEDIYSQAIRAGKRTYFFDVKATKSDEMYLTITESKRRFNNEDGKFQYEKHKVFLFKEDFEKFSEGLKEVIQFIETGQVAEKINPADSEEVPVEDGFKMHSDVTFEDLE